MSYKVSDIIDDVRERIGEKKPDFWSEPGLFTWIDQAQKKIQSNFPHLEATDTDTSVANQQDYDLPDSYLKDGMRKVYYDGTKLNPKDFDTITEEESDVFTAKGTVEDYFIYAGKVNLRKIPEVNGKTIKFFFWKVPDKILNAQQDIEVDDQYFEVIVKYVIEQSMYKQEDYEAGELFGLKADIQREDIKKNKLRRTKDKVPTIQPAEIDNNMYEIG